ncbi:biotin synthase [Thermotomaculum hydrothermale]|uniref:Biotin synthase n=1 Tax=Thermotomaculum hydrothermale TaxID=981385 RepID=A0A7R6PGD7_9BACT|nr:[FeFe] hydrogenase H-cluster radical SAM maturase HydE [Thermotomaculum hydrothermale]BBB33244.1 biotin synthase [Thermotomaculum hydrothermale]
MRNVSQREIEEMLKAEGKEFDLLIEKAGKVRRKHVGNKVYLRGVIEFTNKCSKNCYYCGIRKGNKSLKRYFMSKEDILKSVRFASEKGLGSVVLQGGELKGKQYVSFIEEIIKEIKRIDSSLMITLSLGEAGFDDYKRWFDAGAERCLLRIETSNSDLYKKWHPQDHKFEERLKCLENIKKIGYQTGTGVLIGAPYQTIEDLAKDILFYKDFDVDMIGMGPYVIHYQTPWGSEFKDWFERERENIFKLAIKMIAATRIVMKDINIASTSALAALHSEGRVIGLKAGGNVIMPDITLPEYKENYKLYENKPSLNSPLEQSLNSILLVIDRAGFIPAIGEEGSSLHYLKRVSG